MVKPREPAIKVRVIAAAVAPLDLVFEDGGTVPGACADGQDMTIVDRDVSIQRWHQCCKLHCGVFSKPGDEMWSFSKPGDVSSVELLGYL